MLTGPLTDDNSSFTRSIKIQTFQFLLLKMGTKAENGCECFEVQIQGLLRLTGADPCFTLYSLQIGITNQASLEVNISYRLDLRPSGPMELHRFHVTWNGRRVTVIGRVKVLQIFKNNFKYLKWHKFKRYYEAIELVCWYLDGLISFA